MIDFSEKLQDVNLEKTNQTAESKSETLQHIPLSFLKPFGYYDETRKELHCFRRYSDERLQDLADDIKQNGILSPITVRKRADMEYEILAGHNRCAAARQAGLQTVPCFIKEADDDEAVVIMTTTNLNQREKILPSEKAFAYAAETAARKRISSKKGNSADVPLQEDSRRQIFRYIRLTKLIAPMLQAVDENKLPFQAGVALSYLSDVAQSYVWELVQTKNISVDLEKANRLKETFEKNKTISAEEIENIILQKKKEEKTQPKTQSLQIPTDVYALYFGDMSKKEAQMQLLQILEEYFAKNN